MKCRSKGNPFNTTIIPSPPTESPLPASTSEAQPPGINPVIQAGGPSSSELPHSSGQQKSNMSKKVVWIAVGGFFILVLLALGLCVRMSKWYKEKSTVKVGDHMKSSILNLSSSNPSHPKGNGKLIKFSFIMHVNFISKEIGQNLTCWIKLKFGSFKIFISDLVI